MRKAEYCNLRIRKRPWYAWISWMIWLLWILFWMDVSIGSYKEREPFAAFVSLLIFLVSTAAGLVIWRIQNIKYRTEVPSGVPPPSHRV